MSCSCCNKGVQGLAAIDLGQIGLDQIAGVIQGMSQGDAIELLKKLPESTIRQICTTGVNEEVQGYMPWILLGGVGLIAFMVLK